MALEMIVSPIKSTPISWNWEQLKAEIAERMEPYQSVLVTADGVTAAKKDLANLRKLESTLEDQRKAIKKECEKPYKEFEARMKEITGIIHLGIDNINTQVKAFEDAEVKEKQSQIEKFYAITAGELAEHISLDKLWNPKWLNRTYKMAQVETDISDRLNGIRDDLETIRKMDSPFSIELVQRYYLTLSIADVIRHNTTLETARKRAEEAAERIRQAEQAKAQAPAEQPNPDVEEVEELDPVVDEVDFEETVLETPKPLQQIDFRVWVNDAQKAALRDFLVRNGIRYGSVK